MLMNGSQSRRGRRARIVALRILLLACMLPATAHAQAVVETSSASGAGVHVLLGGFAGRYDLHGGGRTDLLGARGGIGVGELLQVTGFYWRGVDRSAEDITADYAFGGEVQLNLNAGFGVTPFVTGGLASVNQDGAPTQTAAIAGAGLVFPLGPVLLHVGARDYMYGVSGLRNSDSPENVTHNWLYGAGVTFALGRRRPVPATVAVRPPPAAAPGLDAERAALRAAMAEVTALRDSLRAAAMAAGVAPETLARLSALDTLPAVRGYHSAERISIPIPTEGSITLRYGPEPAATATPIVITTPAAAAVPADAAAQAAAAQAAAAQAAAAQAAAAQVAAAGAIPGAQVAVPQPLLAPLPAAPPPGATLGDPATQAWLQQLVAAQVARQVAELGPAATTQGALTPVQLDALVVRVQDGVLAAMLPRLDAAQAQRVNALREEVRVALATQREQILGEFGRQAAFAPPTAAAPAPPPAAPVPDLPPAAPAPALPVPDPIGEPLPGAVPAPPAVEPAPPAVEQPADAAVTAAREEAAQRAALAQAAAGHATVLTAAETERGPAAVLGAAAFESGAALVSDAARAAVRAVAVVLRAHPDRRVYVHGHTDGVGTELQNLRLSELRAEAVRSLLVQEGVESDRVFAVGYGQARPVADDATPRGRALNRRVEIVIGESRAMAAR
jgi:outer membrane protein OmpA-like peptidoglycan-associated protein